MLTAIWLPVVAVAVLVVTAMPLGAFYGIIEGLRGDDIRVAYSAGVDEQSVMDAAIVVNADELSPGDVIASGVASPAGPVSRTCEVSKDQSVAIIASRNGGVSVATRYKGDRCELYVVSVIRPIRQDRASSLARLANAIPTSDHPIVRVVMYVPLTIIGLALYIAFHIIVSAYGLGYALGECLSTSLTGG